MTHFSKFLQACASRSAPERSFLGALQHWAAQRIVRELPVGLAVSDLSRIGLVGAGLTALALVASNWVPGFAVLVPVGVAVNWFGAALDGPLASHRRQGGPKLNLNNHLTDFVSFLTIIVAYGFSPFFTLTAAATILACFLMFSAYHYLRAASGHVGQVVLMGVGATEFRLLLAVWPFFARALGVGSVVEGPEEQLNVVIAGLAVVAIAALIVKVVVDAQRIASARR